MQPASQALRPLPAHVLENRRVQGRHCAGHIQASILRQVRRHKVRAQRHSLLVVGAGVQCRRRRQCCGCEDQGVKNRVDANEKKLGAELGDFTELAGAELVLPGHHGR